MKDAEHPLGDVREMLAREGRDTSPNAPRAPTMGEGLRPGRARRG